MAPGMGMTCELQCFSAVSATKYACIASSVEVGVFDLYNQPKQTHVMCAVARLDGDQHLFSPPTGTCKMPGNNRPTAVTHRVKIYLLGYCCIFHRWDCTSGLFWNN